jgi:Raf kinase inhibitor-like YbhB/YbcL family protein
MTSTFRSIAVALSLTVLVASPAAAASFRSPAFDPGTFIPKKFTCDGVDTSPPLRWSGQPEDTVEFAVLVVDPDAAGFVHWVVAGIPGARSGIPKGTGDPHASPHFIEGRNSFGKVGWDGPCPPHGSTHHYRFMLFAAPEALGLSGHPTAGQLRQAVRDHDATRTTFSARYRR